MLRKASNKLRGRKQRRKAAALERLHAAGLGAGPGASESESCGVAVVPVAPGGGCCGAGRVALVVAGAVPGASEAARFVPGVVVDGSSAKATFDDAVGVCLAMGPVVGGDALFGIGDDAPVAAG